MATEPANRADKLREADSQNLQFPYWCAGEDSAGHIFPDGKIARPALTVFALRFA